MKRHQSVSVAATLCILLVLAFIVFPLLRVFGEGLPAFLRMFDISATGSVRDSVRDSVRLRAVVTAALGNSLLLCVLSTAASVATGFVYAYGVVRGAFPRPLARFFAFIPVLHLVTPPFVGGLSFIFLFGRQGFFTKTLLGLDVSLYGLPGLLIAQTLCFFPLAFLMFRSSFDNTASREYAARNLGASPGRVFATITLPLARGAILAATLFIAISVLSDFGNPMLVGGRYEVLAVSLYTTLQGWADAPTSAALGIVLLIPSAALYLIYRFVTRNRASGGGTNTQGSAARFAFSGDASAASGLQTLPPPRPVRAALFIFCTIVALIVAAQFVSIAAGSFSAVWGIDSRPTLAHITGAWRHRAEMANTLFFALAAAFLATLFAAALAFITGRSAADTTFSRIIRRFLDTAALLPAAVPGSLLGLAYVLAWNAPPLRLTGTRAIIVISMIVYELPAAYKIIDAALGRVKKSLDESARSLGATPAQAAIGVVFPAVRSSLAAAFVYVFVRAAGTVSAVIFLLSFHTKLTSVTILNLAAQGDWSGAAALAAILTFAIFVILALAALLSKPRQSLL